MNEMFCGGLYMTQGAAMRILKPSSKDVPVPGTVPRSSFCDTDTPTPSSPTVLVTVNTYPSEGCFVFQGRSANGDIKSLAWQVYLGWRVNNNDNNKKIVLKYNGRLILFRSLDIN